MNFQVAPKLTVINSPNQLSHTFFVKTATGYRIQAAGAGADRLEIAGLGTFDAGKIKDLLAQRAVPGQNEVSTATITVNSVTPGTELYFRVKAVASNFPWQDTHRDNTEEYGRSQGHQVIMKAGDTAASVAGRLNDLLNADSFSISDKRYTATVAGNVITFTSKDQFTELKVSVDQNPNVTVEHAVTTPGYEGRGTYEQLKAWRWETTANSGPYSDNRQELPTENANYLSLQVKQLIEREDLSHSTMINAGPVTGVFAWHMYVDESMGAAFMPILDWFEAQAETKTFFAATTSNGALAQPETTTTTSTNFKVGL